MYEDNPSDVKAFFGGIEPVETQDLDSVQEQRLAIPASRNVRLKVDKLEFGNNKDNTFRFFKLNLRLTEGIGEDGKFKNKVIFTQPVCYYVDPNVYTKDYFKNRQHLVSLKYLLSATDLKGTPVDGHLQEKLEGKMVLGDVIQYKDTYTTKGGDEINETKNDVKNYKPVPVTDGV